MKILTAEQLQKIDNITCERQGIDSLELMERAAEAAACEIISRFLPSRRFVVVAGPGNNGGDALAVARKLIEQGYRKVEIFLFNPAERLTHDCEEERKKLITIDGIDFTEVVRGQFSPPYLGKNDVVIDGLFGSGLNRPLDGGFRALAEYINDHDAYVVSLDVPSGLMGERNDNINRRHVVHADLTLTFQLPRLSFFFEENYALLGEWKLLDIDLDPNAIKEAESDFRLVEQKSVRPLLRQRLPFTAKRDYGSALLFAGSTGMMGAAVLAATATIRSGAGLVTVHSGRQGINIVQTALPEAIYQPDRNDHFITDMAVLHNHQVIAVGPGIGSNDRTVDALESLLKTCEKPLLLDADALNCIARRPTLLTMLPQNTVITPHAGEFDRLFGEHTTDEQRLFKAIEMAKYYNIIIVLKGHYTAVVRPTGRVYFNSTGNPGMATAGAGDVLTGVITAFIAQGYRPEYAATIGVYIHGLAGDIAEEELGEFGLIASDIAAYVGRAIRKATEKTYL